MASFLHELLRKKFGAQRQCPNFRMGAMGAGGCVLASPLCKTWTRLTLKATKQSTFLSSTRAQQHVAIGVPMSRLKKLG